MNVGSCSRSEGIRATIVEGFDERHHVVCTAMQQYHSRIEFIF